MTCANDLIALFRRTILIVDTDVLLLEVLEMALTQEDYIVVILSDYDVVSEMVYKFQPSMVIVGCRLTSNRAQVLCKQLKQSNEQLILIALSCDGGIATQYTSLGFNDFIQKPFELDDLFDKIKSYLL